MALGLWGHVHLGIEDARSKQEAGVVPGHPFVPPGTDGGDNNTGSVPHGKPTQNEDEMGGA